MKQKGFTIVELLIVIVVIGILAAITIVAYNGIQNRAHDTSIQNDLRNYATKVREYQAIYGTLPDVTSAEFDSLNFKASTNAYGTHYTPTGTSGYNLIYCNNADRFAIVAGSKSGNILAYRSHEGLVESAGPLTTYTTTCSNQGVSDYGTWGMNNGNWEEWTK